MTEFMKYPNAPIAADGWPIIGISLLIVLSIWGGFILISPVQQPILKWGLGVLGAVGMVFILFSLWFFRNPERTPASTEPGVVLSAADGKVLKVEKVNDPRYGSKAQKISIFMSPMNVHVNRAPVSGTIEKVEYTAGKFFAANLDKASLDNERNWVLIKTDDGQRVGFLQIAGFIARRIVCHVRPGDHLSIGQRYGMIRFGSRMEIFLPEQSKIWIKPGDVLLSGHTVVAKLPTVHEN